MPDRNGKLSDAELREPHVTLVIPEARYWQLPKVITEVLRLYIGRYDKKGNMVYEVPAYLYREWTHLLPLTIAGKE
jgi:hypothetical protein